MEVQEAVQVLEAIDGDSRHHYCGIIHEQVNPTKQQLEGLIARSGVDLKVDHFQEIGSGYFFHPTCSEIGRPQSIACPHNESPRIALEVLINSLDFKGEFKTLLSKYNKLLDETQEEGVDNLMAGWRVKEGEIAEEERKKLSVKYNKIVKFLLEARSKVLVAYYESVSDENV